MTTDELKALLRDQATAITWILHNTSEFGDYLVFLPQNLRTGKDNAPMLGDLSKRINAALASDFAVVPRKITKEMSDALNAMAQCEGFIEEGYNDMIKVAEGK